MSLIAGDQTRGTNDSCQPWSPWRPELGLSLAESARQLGVTTSAVYRILRRQN